MTFGPREALASVFGLGLLRPAPGTWGSLPPPAILGAIWLAGGSSAVGAGAMLGLLVVFSVACIALGPWAETRWGKKDPRQVVADETAGQAVALLGAPWAWFGAVDGAGVVRTGAYLAAAFLLFRIFDIVKPPPAGGLQRLPAGWGILIDDLLAGVYALVILQVVWRFLI